MAPFWRKTDVQRLLQSLNTHNTYETASREILSSRFSPSECKTKFNELLTQPWTKEENLELERMVNLVYSNPCMASVQLCRPMAAIQAQLDQILQSRRPTLFRFLEVKGDKIEKVVKRVLIGLEWEREALQRMMRGDGNILICGPGGVGKKHLLREVAEDLGLKVKNLSRESKLFRKKRECIKEFFANSCKETIIIVDDASLRDFGKDLNELGGYRRICGVLSHPMDFKESNLKKLFPKRLWVELPNPETRTKILATILSEEEICISEEVDLQVWGTLLYGHNYKEIRELCEIAASFRLKEQQDEMKQQDNISLCSLRRVSLDDFKKGIDKVSRRTSLSDLQKLKGWWKEERTTV